MARSFFIIAALALVLLGMVLPAQAMLNPSAVYCRGMGYQYEIGSLSGGSQVGWCRMPDNRWVVAWKFLRNQEGQQYNYCSRMGYPSKTSDDVATCSAIHDTACTVCTLPDGREAEVTTLMGLNLYETTCGDGRCVIDENYRNCPADCPQSGNDGQCQPVTDLKCDPDCVVGPGDPDCLYLQNPLLTAAVVLIIIGAVAGLWYFWKRRRSPPA